MSELSNPIATAINYINILHLLFLFAFGYAAFSFLRDWWCGENGLSASLGLFMASLAAGEIWSIWVLVFTDGRTFYGVLWRSVQLTFVFAAIVNLIIQHRRTAREIAKRKPNQGDKATSTGPSSDA